MGRRGELGWWGWECGVGGRRRSALLSNVSCHFPLCLQSETASRKQGGGNRIKTVPQCGGGGHGGVTCRERGSKRGKKVGGEKMDRGKSRFGNTRSQEAIIDCGAEF